MLEKWRSGGETWQGWRFGEKGENDGAFLSPCSIMRGRGREGERWDTKEGGKKQMQKQKEKRVSMAGKRSWRDAKTQGGGVWRGGGAGQSWSLQVSWKSFSSVRRFCSAMCIWFSRSWGQADASLTTPLRRNLGHWKHDARTDPIYEHEISL